MVAFNVLYLIVGEIDGNKVCKVIQLRYVTELIVTEIKVLKDW